MSDVVCVDVVVDVPSSQVDRAYTYLAGAEPPALGARVRVPFGGRIVGGWVVSPPLAVPGGNGELKAIASVDGTAAHFGPEAVRLAAWLRRRYACTFREALSAVAPRALAGADRSTYAFVRPPQPGDRLGAVLHKAFGEKPFGTIAAARAATRARLRANAARIGAELSALARRGIIARGPGKSRKATRAAPRPSCAVLVDAGAAKGAVQQRLAAALSEHGGRLPIAQVRRTANASAQSVARAALAGVLRIEEEARGAPGAARAGAPAFSPTDEQRRAIEAIDGLARGGGGVALLHGVTGSGKTFVYSRLVDRVRGRGGRAIVLVPEIALTPQTAARFTALFGSSVGVLHSGLSAGDRARVWEDATAGAIDVVVGARSAVFAPLPSLALIVVDEEHEPSYKQDVAPRYDAAAVARQRMRAAHGVVVLGSATPSLETYREATAGEIGYVPMRARATSAPLPPVEIVDMTGHGGAAKGRSIGPALLDAMERAIARGEKVLLFVNRRGYAGLLLCRACGFAPRCKRCAVSLVLHTADQSLRCHICGDGYRVPTACPKCGAPDLRPYGFGTQRVEEEIAQLLPEAKVVRMDSDTTSGRGAHARLLDSFGGDGDVLVGTQMIAKGLDFPTVTVVGVVSADLDLNRPDFRAAERTFALLTQVAGRAGRVAPGSRVVVQTYSPQHYAVRLAATHDYDAFAAKELGLRRELHYPPFGRLAYIGVSGVDLKAVTESAAQIAATLRERAPQVETLGPAPDPMPKARGEYRLRVAIKAQSEDALLDACARVQALRRRPEARVTVVVDPR
ncbi:MAG TPA: primosomal protein N' [Candidatus Eremiobacteraceae bacterium]|nr:primosomal protein N' [Candidatus Eremiobacteraceae bacterium]